VTGFAPREEFRETLCATENLVGGLMHSDKARKKFQVVLIKSSHYDDDGYVIQWARSLMPANSLACIYGLTMDVDERKVLGDDVEIAISAYDENNIRIPIKKIITDIQSAEAGGFVGFTGVQSNQFPRAMDVPVFRYVLAASMSAGAWRCCRNCRLIFRKRKISAFRCSLAKPRAALMRFSWMLTQES